MMTQRQLPDDWREQAQPIRRVHLRLYQIFGAAALCVLIVFIAYSKIADDRHGDFEINLLTELLGVLITTLALSAIQIWWNERQQLQELIIQMSSQSKEFALVAAKLLAKKGWLQDGSLGKANLSFANLHRAYLANASMPGADLRGTRMQNATLENANLRRADLRGIKLGGANLRGADLRHVNAVGADMDNANLYHVKLQGANLRKASLQGASLRDADLRGCNLRQADLKGAVINKTTQFDAQTTLPDGKRWQPGADLSRFIGGNWKPTRS